MQRYVLKAVASSVLIISICIYRYICNTNVVGVIQPIWENESKVQKKPDNLYNRHEGNCQVSVFVLVH